MDATIARKYSVKKRKEDDRECGDKMGCVLLRVKRFDKSLIDGEIKGAVRFIIESMYTLLVSGCVGLRPGEKPHVVVEKAAVANFF